MKRVEQIANKILNDLKINTPPVNLKKILKSLDVDLEYDDLPNNISGILDVKLSNKPRIIVNNQHHEVRQRFTIAHEIGHFLLHNGNEVHVDKNIFFRDYDSQKAIYSGEIEANKFAAELLMPTRMINNIINNLELNNKKFESEENALVTELAAVFNVSILAMTIKLQSTGYFIGE